MKYDKNGHLLTENSPFYQEYGTYYEAKYSCSTCSYVFSVVTQERPKGKGPSCPQCKEHSASKGTNRTKGRLKTQKETQKNVDDIISARQAPSIGGRNTLHKAHDDTMKLVMEDYGLTDINDRPYEGENCVPKLPSHLEEQVGSGFGSNIGNIPQLTSKVNPGVLTSTGMASINSGKFRDQGDVVAMQQKFGPKPKFNIIN